jgi:hypothetical protein
MAISMPGICLMNIVQLSSKEDKNFSEIFCKYDAMLFYMNTNKTYAVNLYGSLPPMVYNSS